MAGYRVDKRGRNFAACCPFHADSRPSMYLYTETNSFYCFGCQAGGDVVALWARMQNMGMGEAAKDLCNRFNVRGRDESRPVSELTRKRPFSKEERTRDCLLTYIDNESAAVARVLDDFRRDALDLMQTHRDSLDAQVRELARQYRSPIEASGDEQILSLTMQIGVIVSEQDALRNADYATLLGLCLRGSEAWRKMPPFLGTVT